MSSFTRRIERQQHASRKVHPVYDKADRFVGFEENPPRKKFYLGRGKALGVTNPKAKDMLARLAREARRAA